MHPQARKALSELNIKYFFTDAREFKRKGNTEMHKLAVAHIKRLRKEINDARSEMRKGKRTGGISLCYMKSQRS